MEHSYIPLYRLIPKHGVLDRWNLNELVEVESGSSGFETEKSEFKQWGQ